MDFLKDQTICFLQGTQFRFKDTNRMEYTLTHIHTHAMQTVKKRAEVTILISDKINFKTRIVIRHKEGHFKMTKKFIKRI